MEYRILAWVLLSLFVLIGNARADGLHPRALSINDIPPCGIQCLFLAVPPTGCSFSDIQCQCQNENLAHTLSACMLANCTMQDSLCTAQVQADLCNLSDESRTRQVVMYTAIVFSIAVIFVSLRIAGKVLAKRVTLDDWILVAAMLLTAIPCGCVLVMCGMGFGNHLWNLKPGQLKPCLRFFFISWSTYVIVLGLIKVSLILFYLQIFISQRFRIVAYIVLTYVIFSTLCIYFVTIFSCTPVKSFWDRDIKGKCLDITALAYANSWSAIAQDIIILVLPMASVRRLKTNRWRKMAVGVMFAVGTFGCVTTILRLRSLLDFKISIDPTWDYVPVTIWTELELASGFVCVSLPAIRILLTMIFPRNLLSSITSRRSRSNSTPQRENKSPNQERSARNGFSWMHIPTTNDELTGLSSMSTPSWWHSNSRTQRSQVLGSVDLMPLPEPTKPQKCSHIHMITSPAIQFDGYLREDQRLRSPAIPEPARTEFCHSCGSETELITALPQLGCLPDGSYSGELREGRRHRAPT